MSSVASIGRTLANARQRLLDERVEGGWWEGQLSSSALSTATACAALALCEQETDRALVAAGLSWLATHQNADGGFGDTPDSASNLSTSALSWMALRFGREEQHVEARQGATDWLQKRLGTLDPEHLATGLREVYADDRTFAVPILVACAAGGAFGPDRNAWRPIPHLPFELAALPRICFKWLGLSVVSYALPALIAIGVAIEFQCPSRNPLTRALRALCRRSTLRTLARIQPRGGGFLEATPLTSFVVLSLTSCGRREHRVVQSGLGFLRRSMRADDSWPIDTNLATWVSSLAVNALAGGNRLQEHLPPAERDGIAAWLAAQQQRGVHPYTGAAPGGWAWTDLPGAVPDADDTAGALLALSQLTQAGPELQRAGAHWLRDLQNADGGIPTFCSGWGKLPFDASCPDLSAHALRAWAACATCAPATKRAQQYLVRCQREDGSWLPLWFGNQHQARGENPVYGTSRVLCAMGVAGDDAWRAALERGRRWLLGVQNEDGGFGGDGGLPSTVEETGLALEALARGPAADDEPEALTRAASFLVQATCEGTVFAPQPIGLYFAQLWYSERLYPLIFTVAALERCQSLALGATSPA